MRTSAHAHNTAVNTSHKWWHSKNKKKEKKKGGRRWFCGTVVISEESKHGARADLCRLSLVKQG